MSNIKENYDNPKHRNPLPAYDSNITNFVQTGTFKIPDGILTINTDRGKEYATEIEMLRDLVSKLQDELDYAHWDARKQAAKKHYWKIRYLKMKIRHSQYMRLTYSQTADDYLNRIEERKNASSRI